MVLATGACIRPAIPGIADAVPRWITTLTALTYRDPSQLPEGGVLVIGARIPRWIPLYKIIYRKYYAASAGGQPPAEVPSDPAPPPPAPRDESPTPR